LKRLPSGRVFWAYLAILGLLSIVIAWIATSTYGAGVGTDGVIYLSTADSLMDGKGFVYFETNPYIRWPPLYPLTIALLSRLTGVDVFIAAWSLNVILLGAIVWLGGALLFGCFQDELIWAYLGSLITAMSVSLLSLSATVGSDPLFIALILAFLLASNRYVASQSTWGLVGMSIAACLACLQRLPGITAVATGLLLILYTQRRNFKQALLEGSAFSITALGPLLVWLVGHNYLRYQTVFGSGGAIRAEPLVNLQNSLNKIFHWFFPYIIPTIVILVALSAALFLLILISEPHARMQLARRLAAPPLISSLVFSAIYFSSLAVTLNSDDTNFPYYDRYQIVLLVPLLVLFFAILQELVLSRATSRPLLARGLFIIAFAVWLIYPAFRMYKYVVQSRADGEITYNRYNTRALREQKILGVLAGDNRYKNENLYTNYPAVAWFYTRGKVYESPRARITEKPTLDILLNRYAGWPGDQPGYLIWFTPNEYLHVYAPEDLRKLAVLTQVYRGAGGEVYRVRPRSP